MRCGIYIRVSTNKEEQKSSLINQKDLFIKYVAEKGWDIHDFYIDIQSGTTGKRKELQRFIADAKAKKFDVMMAKELSRLARNGGLSYEIRDIALQNNIDILTLDNAINTLEGNKSNFGLYAWLYEEESQRTSIRVKQALKTKAQKGEFKGSIAPYGYIVENKRLFIRSDEIPSIVQRIYKDFITGKGFDRIARELYEEGIATPSQIAVRKNNHARWSGSSVRRILENPHYVGDIVQGRTTTKSVTVKSRHFNDQKDFITVLNQHEGIISKEDFATVQQIIKSRRKTRPQAEAHLFTNTAYCADCGKGMHYKKNCKGYICGSYNRLGIKACSNHLIREKELISIVLHDIEHIVSKVEKSTISSAIKPKLEKQKNQIEKKIKNIEAEIVLQRKRKKQAHTSYFDDVITKEDFDEYISSTNEEIEMLINKKQELISSSECEDASNTIKYLKNSIETFLQFKKLTPEVLHRMIERIEIKADGGVKIFYRFPNQQLLQC